MKKMGICLGDLREKYIVYNLDDILRLKRFMNNVDILPLFDFSVLVARLCQKDNRFRLG